MTAPSGRVQMLGSDIEMVRNTAGEKINEQLRDEMRVRTSVWNSAGSWYHWTCPLDDERRLRRNRPEVGRSTPADGLDLGTGRS